MRVKQKSRKSTSEPEDLASNILKDINQLLMDRSKLVYDEESAENFLQKVISLVNKFQVPDLMVTNLNLAKFEKSLNEIREIDELTDTYADAIKNVDDLWKPIEDSSVLNLLDTNILENRESGNLLQLVLTYIENFIAQLPEGAAGYREFNDSCEAKFIANVLLPSKTLSDKGKSVIKYYDEALSVSPVLSDIDATKDGSMSTPETKNESTKTLKWRAENKLESLKSMN